MLNVCTFNKKWQIGIKNKQNPYKCITLVSHYKKDKDQLFQLQLIIYSVGLQQENIIYPMVYIYLRVLLQN